LPKIPEGKRGLYVYIDKQICVKLYHLIHEKHGQDIYGALSAEVEEALERHLETVSSHANTHKFGNPALPRTHRTCIKIIEDLRKNDRRTECTPEDVYLSVSNVQGSDRRTHEKWIKTLVQLGYLTWTAHRTLEISSRFQEWDEFAAKLEKAQLVEGIA